MACNFIFKMVLAYSSLRLTDKLFVNLHIAFLTQRGPFFQNGMIVTDLTNDITGNNADQAQERAFSTNEYTASKLKSSLVVYSLLYLSNGS